MKAKRTLFTFLFIIISAIILFLSALYVYDPMQIFHKHWIAKKDSLSHNMRFQAAGIINNYKFDSVILGTSMLENTSALETSKMLGGDFFNISLSGSSLYERSYILDYVLRKKNIKKVLMSLDGTLNDFKFTGSSKYPIEKYNYLYDINPFNDVKVYINDKYLNCLLTLSTDKVCVGNVPNMDKPNAWYRSKAHGVRFGGIDHWFNPKYSDKPLQKISNTAKKIKKGESIPITGIENKVKLAKIYLNKTLVMYIEKYKTTEFILILPPYTRIRYSLMAQYDKPTFEVYKSMIRYLVELSTKYENMKIYGWGDRAFLDDIANYKDTGHYHPSINVLMLKEIKDEKGLLTADNIDEYLTTFTKKALEYNLVEVGNKIDNYLKHKKK